MGLLRYCNVFLSEESALIRLDLFGVAANSCQAHDLLTRSRGMALCAFSTCVILARDPLKARASFVWLLRACEAESAEEAHELVRDVLSAEACCSEALFGKRMLGTATSSSRRPTNVDDAVRQADAERYLLQQALFWNGQTSCRC